MEEKESLETDIVCSPKWKDEIDETAHLKMYIMWENKSNICWLDASLALIAHNKVIRKASEASPKSKIRKIIENYDKAISLINTEPEKRSLSWVEIVNFAKSLLNHAQEHTVEYLQPILKYNPGDPESAFCSLYNLLKEDFTIKGIFDATWISIKTCTSCEKKTESTKTKPLITLSKVDSFDPISPTVIYNCSCGKSDQKIKIEFVTLPPCLIFHFENGAGHEKPPLNFVTHERHYYLTGITTLEKGQESNVNHFITWVRDPFVDKWLDCNDLNPDMIYFTPNFPDIRFEDVFFYAYESFDDLGKIRDYEKVNLKNSEEDIVLIDITDESENSNSVSSSELDIKVEKHDAPSAESQVISTKKDPSKSRKEILAGKEEPDSEKIIQANSTQSSETACSDIKDSKNDENAADSIKKMSLDQGTDHNIQNEEKAVDSVFQDSKISFDKSDKDASEEVLPPNLDSKIKFETSILINQTKPLSDPKPTDSEDTDSPCQEKKLENIAAIEEPKSIEGKEDKQNEALLPVNEIHISDLKDGKPEDITKADIAKSGMSFVKLSFHKRKYPGLAFLKQNSKQNNKHSDETTTASLRKSPRSVRETKDLKRTRDEEWDTMPEKRPRKDQNFENTLVGLHSNANEGNKNTTPEKRPRKNQKLEKVFKGQQPNKGDTMPRKRGRKAEKFIKTKKGLQSNANEEDRDAMPEKYPKKNKKSGNTLEGLQSNPNKEVRDTMAEKKPKKSQKVGKILGLQSNANEHIDKNNLLSLQDKSKIQNIISTKKTQQKQMISQLTSIDDKSCKKNQVFTNQHMYSSMFCATENSNKNYDKDGKVLKEFEDVWSSHAPGCFCEGASNEEIISSVVDYTFAYLCKLSQGLKKANAH